MKMLMNWFIISDRMINNILKLLYPETQKKVKMKYKLYLFTEIMMPMLG